jgi:SynChlorMet cassette radical SAM/SPASM protein ScmE
MPDEVIKDVTKPAPPVVSAPRKVDIAITGRCNLRCKYCFYADSMTALADLPTESWLAFFAELGNLAVQRVTLTGGEVFTRPDLFELIDGVIANRMRYSLLSNGTLITEEVLAQFAIGKRRLRLDSIQVSIDGSRAEIHDQSRPKSFDRALRGLRLLKEAGFPVTVRVTINQHNVDDLPNIARLLMEDVGLPSFSTNEAFPMGSGKCPGESVTLTRDQRQQAMDTLQALNERYDGRIGAQAGPLALARQFADIEARLARGETEMPGRGKLAACGGVFDKVDILHDGTIVPCHLLPSFSMGKVGVDDLKDVWQHHPNINTIRQRRPIPIRSLEPCHDCRYAGFCTGGCPGGVMNATGTLMDRDPAICYRIHRGDVESPKVRQTP